MTMTWKAESVYFCQGINRATEPVYHALHITCLEYDVKRRDSWKVIVASSPASPRDTMTHLSCARVCWSLVSESGKHPSDEIFIACPHGKGISNDQRSVCG